jgi:hypothetical protein
MLWDVLKGLLKEYYSFAMIAMAHCKECSWAKQSSVSSGSSRGNRPSTVIAA